jgi:hypothetical protein
MKYLTFPIYQLSKLLMILKMQKPRQMPGFCSSDWT